MKRILRTLCMAALLSASIASTNSEAAAITLTQPSGEEWSVAPQRDFVVSGRLTDLAAPADVRVELYDNKNRLLRSVTSQVDKVSGVTAKEQLLLDYKHGRYYLFDDNAALIANPPPDLIAGTDGKQLNNPSNKAVVNAAGEFAAVILGGVSKTFDTDYADTALGAYGDLPSGSYTLRVYALDAASGAVVAEAKHKLTLSGSERIVFGRFSPDAQSGYAHREKLADFAAAHKARLLNDALPGYWSRPQTDAMAEVFYEIPLRWRLNDAQEYLAAKQVLGVIYNISEGSTVQNVEIGALTASDYIDNPASGHKVSFYHYDIGEVDLEYLDAADKPVRAEGALVPFASEGSSYRQNDITRVEIRSAAAATQENDYWPKDSRKYIDFDITDGVNIRLGEYISIFGVTTPIRTGEVERAADDDALMAGTYEVNNQIATIRYTVTAPDGSRLDVAKPVGLKRHYFVNKIARSGYEYKHILGSDVFSSAGRYTVSLIGCDKNGRPVSRTAAEFSVNVSADK